MCRPCLDSWVFFISREIPAQNTRSSAADILRQVLHSQEMETSQVPHTYRLTPLSLSNLGAKYLGYQFQSKLNACLSQSIGVAMALHAPPLMPLVPSELDCIALVLVDTFLNCGK